MSTSRASTTPTQSQNRLPPINILSEHSSTIKLDIEVLIPRSSDSTAPSPAADELPSKTSNLKRHREPSTSTQPPATTSSSRGVANLTPSQLAKKRANDREAQRAIRTRTKLQIENLERRIRELTNQQPYVELEGVVKERDALREELRALKERVRGVMEVLEGVVAGGGPAGIGAYVGAGERDRRPGTRGWTTPAITASSTTAGTSPGASAWPAPAADSRVPPLARQAPGSYHMVPGRLGLDYVLDGSQRTGKLSNGHTQSQESSTYSSLPKLLERGGPIQQRSNIGQHNLHTPTLPNALLNLDLPYYAIPVRNSPPSCPLDALLLDFIHEKQALISRGTPILQVLGPPTPSLTSLLPSHHPACTYPPHPDSTSLTTLIGNILVTFGTLSPLPEKLAFNTLMFLYMRWAIAPSQESYDALPSSLVPRVSQISTPHPAWIDYLPYPTMRDQIIRRFVEGNSGRGRVIQFDDFFLPFTRTVSLAWEGECLVKRENGEWVLDEAFERHFKREENWSVGTECVRTFPMLEGSIGIRDLR